MLSEDAVARFDVSTGLFLFLLYFLMDSSISTSPLDGQSKILGLAVPVSIRPFLVDIGILVAFVLFSVNIFGPCCLYQEMSVRLILALLLFCALL